jgi:hypothetical protein
MVSEEEFAKLHNDFISSQDFIQYAHDRQPNTDFVCHHNAYLVTFFLQRLGHEDLRWVSGYYQCSEPERRIRHSWIKLVRDRKLVAIFEFDPRQLHEKGKYEGDLMPSGYVPRFSINTSGTASIVDPDLVAVPEEEREFPWVVPSSEILLRYVEDDDLVPELDFADLDKLAVEAQQDYFRNLTDLDESDLE